MPQRLERLLAIPGAAARPAQPGHDVDELLEGVAGVAIGRPSAGGRHEAAMLAFEGGEPGGSGRTDIDFAGFMLSLATTAAVHFGDIPDPGTGERAGAEPRRRAGR